MNDDRITTLNKSVLLIRAAEQWEEILQKILRIYGQSRFKPRRENWFCTFLVVRIKYLPFSYYKHVPFLQYTVHKKYSNSNVGQCLSANTLIAVNSAPQSIRLISLPYLGPGKQKYANLSLPHPWIGDLTLFTQSRNWNVTAIKSRQ